MRVFTLFSNQVDILPEEQMRLLKGTSDYKYSNRVIIYEWKDKRINIYQENDALKVKKQTEMLRFMLDAKCKYHNKNIDSCYWERLESIKSVFGVEIVPDVDSFANEIISTICYNTNCLVLSGDTILNESLEKII